MEDRIAGTASDRRGEVHEFEASWYNDGNLVVWDAVLRRDGQVRKMLGGKVLLDDDLPDARHRIRDFVRDAIEHDLRLDEVPPGTG